MNKDKATAATAAEKFLSEETNKIYQLQIRCFEKAKQISEVKPFKRPKKYLTPTNQIPCLSVIKLKILCTNMIKKNIFFKK